MKKKDARHVLHRIDWEGFDHCFMNYSNWEEVKDERFHELRTRYVEAASELQRYVHSSANPPKPPKEGK